MDEKPILDKTFFGKVGTFYNAYVREITAALGKGTHDVSRKVTANGHTLIVPDRESTDRLKRKLEWENAESTILRSMLTKAKIATGAIIPTDVFEKLLAQSEYVTFYNMSAEGKGIGNTKKLDELISKQRSSSVTTLMWILGIAGFLISALITFVVHKTTRLDLGWFGLARMVPAIGCLVITLMIGDRNDQGCGVVIGFITAMVSYIAPPSIILLPLGILIGTKIPFMGMSQTDAKNVLWPERNDQNISEGTACEITIPSTGNEHVRILMSRCQAVGVPITTSLHTYSFTVKYPDVDGANRENERGTYGLVIATTYGSMIAILGQTGEFPLRDQTITESIRAHFSEYSKGLVESAILYDEKLVVA